MNGVLSLRSDVGAPPTTQCHKSAFNASRAARAAWPECKHSSRRHMKVATRWCLRAWWWTSSTAFWATMWSTWTVPSLSWAFGEVSEQHRADGLLCCCGAMGLSSSTACCLAARSAARLG